MLKVYDSSPIPLFKKTIINISYFILNSHFYHCFSLSLSITVIFLLMLSGYVYMDVFITKALFFQRIRN